MYIILQVFLQVLQSILVFFSTTLGSVHGTLPWDRWSWAAPQAPIVHFFRRYDNNQMPIKIPSLKCECPPNKGNIKLLENFNKLISARKAIKNKLINFIYIE